MKRSEEGRILLRTLLLAFVLAPLSPTSVIAQASRAGVTFSASAGGLHRYPDVAFDTKDGVYLGIAGANPIKGRFVASDGTVLGPGQFKIPQTNAYTQTPRVEYSPDLDGGNGGFLVTWLDTRLNPNSSAVFGRLIGFNQDGTPKFLTNDFQISNTTGVHPERAPAIKYGSNIGRFLVAWHYVQNDDIRARLVSTAGALIGSELAVTNDTIGQTHPTVAYNPSAQEFYVVYSGYTATSAFVKGQRVNGQTGGLVGSPLTIDVGGATYVPHVIFDGTQYFVAWYRTGKYYGRFITAAGATSGNLILLSSGVYDALGLALNPISNTYFLVTHDTATVEDRGFQISSTGLPEGSFVVTAAGGTGNYNPRIAAATSIAEWLVVTANSFNKLVGQRVKTAGFVGGNPPPPPPPPPSGGGGGSTGGGTGPALPSGQWITPLNTTVGNYNGDGADDVAIFRNPTGEWFISQSTSGNLLKKQWGNGQISIGDVPIPADFDGDGKTDLAVYRRTTGDWFVQKSTGGVLARTFGSPASFDVPVPGDYDGDGKADIATYRRPTGAWNIIRSSTNSQFALSLGSGTNGDVPVPADYDGDGTTDIAVFRTSTGEYFVRRSSDNVTVTTDVGAASVDLPVPADYDGDGKADLGVFSNATGQWHVLLSGGGQLNLSWGAPALGDTPVPGKYFGGANAKAAVAVFRRSTGQWFIRQTNGQSLTFTWGAPSVGDIVRGQ